MPTGSAVVSDIIDLTRNILSGSPGRVPLPPAEPRVALRPHDDIRTAYYLHFQVKDEPGVLARTASKLGERRISIAAVEQREQNDQGKPVPLMIVTHRAREPGSSPSPPPPGAGGRTAPRSRGSEGRGRG